MKISIFLSSMKCGGTRQLPFCIQIRDLVYVPNDQPKHRSIVSVFFSTSRRVSKVLHQQKKGSALPPSEMISGTILYIHEGRFVAGSIIGIIWRYLLLLSFDDTGKRFFSLSAEACHRFRASIWVSHLLLLVRAHAMMNELKNKI